MKIKFSSAYEQCRDSVYGYLLYMSKDIQLAEDLSQETFLKMFLNMHKYKGNSSVKTWALKIARNTFLTYAKKKQPLLLEEQDLETEIYHYINEPEDLILQKELGEQIKKTLMALNEQDRTVLLLRDYEQLSYEEISQILGISAEVLKSRLFRARQKFKKQYALYKENTLNGKGGVSYGKSADGN